MPYDFTALTARRAAGTNRPCVVEALEGRRLMSAATVLASLRPLAEWPSHAAAVAAAHAHPVQWPGVVGAVKQAVADPGPNLLGTWAGAFTDNSSRVVTNNSIDFTARHNQSFTGSFNVQGIAGASATSTVTVTKTRQFLVVVKLPGKRQVSLAGTVTSDLRAIIGRYSVEGGGKAWMTGVFRLEPKK